MVFYLFDVVQRKLGLWRVYEEKEYIPYEKDYSLLTFSKIFEFLYFLVNILLDFKGYRELKIKYTKKNFLNLYEYFFIFAWLVHFIVG